MRTEGKICTPRPTFAPKQRSRNLRHPQKIRGLHRNNGMTHPHSTRRINSRVEYFVSALFCSMSNMSSA